MLNKLKSILSWIIIISLGVCIIIIIRLKNKYEESSYKLSATEHNLNVAKDSIRVIKDTNGKLEYNKLAYLTDKVSNLVTINKQLSDEIKSIKGSVNSITSAQIKVIEKPVPFEVIKEVKDSTIFLNFKLDTTYSPGNYKILSGFTQYNTYTGQTEAEKLIDEVGVKVITGIKNIDKGKPEIFFKSDYPGLTITSIEGAVIDPTLFKGGNKKTPLITPGITIGWTPVIWNNHTQKLSFSTRSVGITAGLSFNILKLIGIKK